MEIEEKDSNSFVSFEVKKKITKDKSYKARTSKDQSKKNEQNQIQKNTNVQQNEKQKTSQTQKPCSLVGISAIENEENQENQPVENLKAVEMEIIPIVRHLKMQTVYMLAGDVMVDLDFGMKEDEHPYCQISAINSFKNPIKVEVLKEYMSNEVDLTNSQDSLKEFRKIIEILENYPDKYAHDFGKVLRQYQIFVTGQIKKAEFLKSNLDYKSLIPTFDKQFEEFLVDARQYLKQIITKNKFQFYMIVRSNVHTLTHDIAKFGLSEGLCQLLGGNGDQIGSLILRRGLFEFFSKETRNNFYFYYLSKFLNVKDVQIEKSISLVTLDGIELKVDYEMDNYFGKNTQPDVLFFYPFMLITITFDVKPYMVKQVLNIRQTLDNETQQYMKDFEEDIYYSLESQIFLENYYADYYEKIMQNNGKCLPKEKRKYKKHPQTKHQLDFRQQNQSVFQNIKQNSKLRDQKFQTIQNESINEEVNDQVQNSDPSSNTLKDQQDIQDIQIQDNNSNNMLSENNNSVVQNNDSEGEQNTLSDKQVYQQNYRQNHNSNHLNQYPYVSYNYTNYENLDVHNFNQKQCANFEQAIPKHQQKIQLQENICIYQSSQYANNAEKLDISKIPQNLEEMNDYQQIHNDIQYTSNLLDQQHHLNDLNGSGDLFKSQNYLNNEQNYSIFNNNHNNNITSYNNYNIIQ
ncbi:hypothetical protein TTHERM_00394510 (macronuclear) [Tetrahymena thermophila SB210]|uniref:Uncharacterized protein n=1 Tax=Tetrahymena thermophila (strain SB210) TaxID=312017 RepID=Q233A2_TETTS|nr:hypothetical protein TTHERM_00394510 [Tetrahymena thermophila SB210]EAR91678.1 hypothetical protein TTHERM_00394510 [Tetrahymena thermophila SB210]|eukprot:XP_001011923.1 hypothetical protein TTHERM_00394510 [Tetrahymena thermophila SB210]